MEDKFIYKHKYDVYDILSEVISVVLIVTNLILICRAMTTLPAVVPNHFDFNGNPNGYGGKNFIWGPFVVSIVIYILITILSRFPEFYQNRMQREDRFMAYRLTVKMTLTLKPVLLAVFLLITYFMIQTAQLKMTQYLKLLIVAILLLIFSHVVYWLIRHSKIR